MQHLMDDDNDDDDDWKLKSHAVVKLKRDANVFVYLYCVSRFITLFNDCADFDFECSNGDRCYLFLA